MTPLLTIYMSGWIIACLVAVYLMWRRRATLTLFQRSYWRFLCCSWKLGTFGVAAIALIVMAPYTGDPTWDYVDAGFMSALTFLTAPWAVGTLFLAVRRKAPLVHAYIAACLWMFSASWTYDAYILFKDGYYPPTWVPNIVLSSILYVLAGMLWNLQWTAEKGVTFGFMEAGWPNAEAGIAFRKLIWFAIPLMLFVTLMIAPFLF